MDSKINLGLLCLMSLLIVCHASSSTQSPAATNGSAAATNGSAAATNGSAAATNGSAAATNGSAAATNGSAATKSSTHPPQANNNQAGSQITQAPAITTAKPIKIDCLDGSCGGNNCSKFDASQTCASDSTLGCQTVTSTAKNVTTYTFSCSKSTCKPDDKTKCCTASKCNTYAAAQQKSQKGNYASSMFGNLVSITIIMLMVLFF